MRRPRPRLRCGHAQDSVRLLPCRPRGTAGPSGDVDADGTLILPGGQLRALVAVEPVNFDCRSHAEQDTLAAHFAALAGSLAPGQLLQVIVESKPSSAETIVPPLFARLTPRTEALTSLVAAVPALAGPSTRLDPCP